MPWLKIPCQKTAEQVRIGNYAPYSAAGLKINYFQNGHYATGLRLPNETKAKKNNT